MVLVDAERKARRFAAVAETVGPTKTWLPVGVALTKVIAVPSTVRVSAATPPASAQSAAQRAESLKLYLERALGMDVMIEAYASLHRAMSGGAPVAPDEAVAGIVPAHKLKYVSLLVELIEKERICERS